MGRTACTEPQCLYTGALYLYLTCSAVNYLLQPARYCLNPKRENPRRQTFIFYIHFNSHGVITRVVSGPRKLVKRQSSCADHEEKYTRADGGVAPHILNLGNRRRWIFIFKRRQVYIHENSPPGTHRIWSFWGPLVDLTVLERGSLVHKLVAISTELSLIFKYNQQEAKLDTLFFPVNCCTCFRPFLRHWHCHRRDGTSLPRQWQVAVKVWQSTRCCMYSFWAPDDGRRNSLKHVEHFTEINQLCNVASRWLYLKIRLR
jgi:hypothetical protein